MKVIQTVLGDIAPEALGVTLMHEHTFWDQSCYLMAPPEEITQKAFLESEVSMGMLGRLHYNMHQHRDNVVNSDPELSIAEMNEFRYAGGHSIVDVTTYGLGRDTRAVRRVAAATGLNIVSGTGLYVTASRPAAMREMSRTALADLFIKEATEGDEWGIKAGLIGEIGVSDETLPPHDVELLELSALVQKETGLAVMIHPPFFEQKAHDILDVLEKAGADLTRVIYAHIDPQCGDIDYQVSILKRGVCLEYDEFGMEFPCTLEKYTRRWLPSDIQRIRAIAELAAKGYAGQIVLSQDICVKAMLTRYGGVGYAHLLTNLVPSMRDEGLTKEHLRSMFVENPRRLLTVER